MGKDTSEKFIELSGRIERVNCEKAYYQNIVYAVCGILDDFFGNRITCGEGIVCGCVSSPTTEVQDCTKNLVEQYKEIKVANLESNNSRRKMVKEILSLEEQLAAAHARIAELERCVVMGGDGKPIAVGDEMKTRRGKLITVQSIRKDHQEGQYYIYDGFGFRSAKSLKQVSSPDSVPEGDKE